MSYEGYAKTVTWDKRSKKSSNTSYSSNTSNKSSSTSTGVLSQYEAHLNDDHELADFKHRKISSSFKVAMQKARQK